MSKIVAVTAVTARKYQNSTEMPYKNKAVLSFLRGLRYHNWVLGDDPDLEGDCSLSQDEHFILQHQVHLSKIVAVTAVTAAAKAE